MPPLRKFVPHRATAVVVALADWAMFGIMVASAALLGPCTAVAAIVLGIPVVFLMERTLGGRTTYDSLQNAVLASLLMCIPLPVAGTVLTVLAFVLPPYTEVEDTPTEEPGLPWS